MKKTITGLGKQKGHQIHSLVSILSVFKTSFTTTLGGTKQ